MTGNSVPRRPDALEHLTGVQSDRPYPSGISLPGEGGKFATDGTVLHWPGNTFICHVQKGPVHDAIRSLQEEVRMSVFAPFFCFLPPASFHMTVFQGISPDARCKPWLPYGASPGMSDKAITRLMDEAVETLRFAREHTVRLLDVYCAYSLSVAGQDSDVALRDMRMQLRDETGIQPPDFSDYIFHITLAYPREWLTHHRAAALIEFSQALTDRYRSDLSAIPLGPVEFCRFDTMHHFEPVRTLV